MWLIHLEGDEGSVEGVKTLAVLCGCTIVEDQENRVWLSGERFELLSTAAEVRAEAERAIAMFNLIHIINQDYTKSVKIGKYVGNLNADGTLKPFMLTFSVTVDVTFTVRDKTDADGDTRRHEQVIANEAKLQDIADALTGSPTRQRLRVLYERICALITEKTSRRYWDNALVRDGYVSKDELTRFKSNLEDPRLGGLDAVHGIASGPIKGTRMNEREGLDFLMRLLRSYLDRQS